MTYKISKFIPVGIKAKNVLWIHGAGILFSLIRSLFYFTSYYSSYNAMFYNYGNKKILIAGATMPDFWCLIDDGVFDAFKIAIFIFFAMIAMNYGYHHKDSKSIYTMKRLPNKYELHIRCITLPVASIALCITLAFTLLMIYYRHYMSATPNELLLPAQWEKLWDYIIYGGKVQ